MADEQLRIIKQINVGSGDPYDIAAKYDIDGKEISTTYAKLSSGKIPSSMLPSYVDDVKEGYYLSGKFYETNNTSGTVITGETGKIYVDLATNKTYRYANTTYIEISSQVAFGKGTAAPNGHTHSVTVSGTTGNNSGSAVAAVTGYGSFSGGSGSLTSNDTVTNGIKYVEAQGTFSAGTTPPASASFTGTETTSGANSGTAVTALTGVRVSSSSSAAPGGHTHNYDKTTGVSLTANTATANGRITYVQSISGTAPSLTGTQTFVTKISGGSGTLTSDTTSTNGIKYVETVALSAGTTPPKSASPTHTSTNSGNNSASVTIASVDSNGVLTLASTAAAHTHTHTYDKTTGVSLTAGTAPSLSTNTVKYLHHTHTAASIPSDGTGTVGIQNGSYSATTRYLSAAPSNEATASAANSGTNFNAATAVASDGTADVAPSEHTHSVTATGNVTLTAGTAPSMGTATIKYLHHTHTGASLGTASTRDVAPHTHTHSYGSSTTALTTGANSGTAVSVMTPVE